jgi:hypothetical protein
LLLVLASVVILRSESRGTHDRILLSQIRHFPNLEVHVPLFISPKSRVARLYTQALGTGRATVEIFDPTTTLDLCALLV